MVIRFLVDPGRSRPAWKADRIPQYADAKNPGVVGQLIVQCRCKSSLWLPRVVSQHAYTGCRVPPWAQKQVSMADNVRVDLCTAVLVHLEISRTLAGAGEGAALHATEAVIRRIALLGHAHRQR